MISRDDPSEGEVRIDAVMVVTNFPAFTVSTSMLIGPAGPGAR